MGKKWRSSRGAVGAGLLMASGVLAVGLALLVSLYGYLNGLRSVAVESETALNAQYVDNQNELSTYVSSFYEKLGLAKLKSEKLNAILLDAVKGRYDKNGAGFGKGSPVFAVMVEAYPNLSGLDVFDKIVDYVSAGREAYKAKQSKLLDQIRAYEKWRADGYLQSLVIVKVIGFPALKARVGNESVTGQAALDKMWTIILASDAKNAYQSGVLEPLKVQ